MKEKKTKAKHNAFSRLKENRERTYKCKLGLGLGKYR